MKTILKVTFGIILLALASMNTKYLTDLISEKLLEWSTSPDQPGSLTRSWFLADLQPAFRITCGYLAFVALGTLLRKPGEVEGKIPAFLDTVIKGLQLIYNLVQCVLCSYMIYASVQEYVQSDYVLVCNTFDVNRPGMATVLQVFYLSKILDFMDTIFIILRQKWRQLSFLHVYHHASIFLVYWLNFNAGYDGDIYLTIILNSFVHLVMYSYYFLSTLSIPVPWKNYVTLLQMAQFLVMNGQALYIIMMGCPYPRNITIFYLLYIISLFFLFQNFYNQTYSESKKKLSQSPPPSRMKKE